MFNKKCNQMNYDKKANMVMRYLNNCMEVISLNFTEKSYCYLLNICNKALREKFILNLADYKKIQLINFIKEFKNDLIILEINQYTENYDNYDYDYDYEYECEFYECIDI